MKTTKTAKIKIGAHIKSLIRRCGMKTENTTETPIYLVLPSANIRWFREGKRHLKKAQSKRWKPCLTQRVFSDT